MSLTTWIDGFQRRHPSAGFPVAVVYKFFDDQGNYLSALITYYAFLSIFPLLLLASSILGFVLQGNPTLQGQILHSALTQFPVIGDQLGSPGGLEGSTAAILVGSIGSLYGALGVAQATQNAMNVMWAVPRNRRPNPLAARLRSLLLLATAGVAILFATGFSVAGNYASQLWTDAGGWARLLVILATTALTALLFVMVFQIATSRPVTVREALPGAVIAAVLWQLLQLVGSVYVGRVVRDANTTNGVFAIVLGLIAWLYLVTLAVVFCAEVNVVRAGHLYPRALLTPFTDNVDLTSADQRAYTGYADAQRAKGFETVDVSFDNEGQNARGDRGRRP